MMPFYIATVQNSATKEELDQELLKSLRKLPRKKESLVYQSENYGGLLSSLRNCLDEALVKLIEKREIQLKNKEKIEKGRVFQLIEIIRRIKTEEMGKFKFLSNFGVQPSNIDLLSKVKTFNNWVFIENKRLFPLKTSFIRCF